MQPQKNSKINKALLIVIVFLVGIIIWLVLPKINEYIKKPIQNLITIQDSAKVLSRFTFKYSDKASVSSVMNGYLLSGAEGTDKVFANDLIMNLGDNDLNVRKGPPEPARTTITVAGHVWDAYSNSDNGDITIFTSEPYENKYVLTVQTSGLNSKLPHYIDLGTVSLK